MSLAVGLRIGGAIFCLLTSIAATPVAAGVLWSGHSAGFTVEWTDKDIIATRDRDGARVFSAVAFAEASFAAAKRQMIEPGGEPSTQTLTITRKFAIVSVAGPFLALKDESYIELTPSAHPGGETRFWTLDLGNGAAPKFGSDDPFAADTVDPGSLSLAPQLFGEMDLLIALKKDSVLGSAIPAATRTLDDAVHALSGTSSLSAERCFEIPADLLSRFAIIGVKDGRAMVRIGLPGAGPCRNNLTQVGLTMPLRTSAKTSVTGVILPPTGIKPLELSATTGLPR